MFSGDDRQAAAVPAPRNTDTATAPPLVHRPFRAAAVACATADDLSNSRHHTLNIQKTRLRVASKRAVPSRWVRLRRLCRPLYGIFVAAELSSTSTLMQCIDYMNCNISVSTRSNRPIIRAHRHFHSMQLALVNWQRCVFGRCELLRGAAGEWFRLGSNDRYRWMRLGEVA